MRATVNGFNRTGIVAVLVAVELLIVIIGVNALRGRGMGMSYSFPTGGRAISFTAKSIQPIAAGTAPRVTIDDPNSGIDVRVSYDGLVHVVDNTTFNGSAFGANGAGYPQLEVTHDGNDVSVSRRNVDIDWFSNATSRQRITVEVPAAARIEITNAGAVDMRGLNGGTIAAHCDDGDIEVSGITTPSLTLTSNDGHIEAMRLAMTGASPQLKLASDDGHVNFSGLFPAGGNYDISTNDGDIEARVAQGSDVTVNASTSDGDIRVDDSGRDSGDDGSSQTIRIGSGAAAMRVHSDDGSVAITTNGAD